MPTFFDTNVIRYLHVGLVEPLRDDLFEFHEDLVTRAVPEPGFNFFSLVHLNDHFDAEQLFYLADPNLHFITADRGYGRIRRAPQRDRIPVLSADDLQNPDLAPTLLVDVLTQG